MTLVVSLLGGPGLGKSTLAAELFVLLKKRHIKVELVTEYAKDCTYEDRSVALKSQPYIFGEQYHRLYRLLGKVDVIITDSPLILSAVYADGRFPNSFNSSCIDIFNTFSNLVFLLTREVDYQDYGRSGSLKEAIKIDDLVSQYLDKYSIGYTAINPLMDIDKCVDRIVSIINK